MPRLRFSPVRSKASARLPGVRDAGFGSDLPWTGYDENTGFGIVGRRTFATTMDRKARYHFITTGYATATGIPADRRTRSHGG